MASLADSLLIEVSFFLSHIRQVFEVKRDIAEFHRAALPEFFRLGLLLQPAERSGEIVKAADAARGTAELDLPLQRLYRMEYQEQRSPPLHHFIDKRKYLSVLLPVDLVEPFGDLVAGFEFFSGGFFLVGEPGAAAVT